METEMIIFYSFFALAFFFAAFIRMFETLTLDGRNMTLAILGSIFWPFTLTVAIFLKILDRD